MEARDTLGSVLPTSAGAVFQKDDAPGSGAADSTSDENTA